ncbi:collagen alpha-1(I) chain-like [Tympanuchus pallidicinctus]|uniref:collagen alpha-1(I) chain-like n=1 Tax=Tympanuchus pallidicinctus TaxID=109042 RepID=UPI0022873774|nr:collagen alpha-1(I) chain-like [Tympanuchus pallidicinctus]
MAGPCCHHQRFTRAGSAGGEQAAPGRRRRRPASHYRCGIRRRADPRPRNGRKGRKDGSRGGGTETGKSRAESAQKRRGAAGTRRRGAAAQQEGRSTARLLRKGARRRRRERRGGRAGLRGRRSRRRSLAYRLREPARLRGRGPELAGRREEAAASRPLPANERRARGGRGAEAPGGGAGPAGPRVTHFGNTSPARRRAAPARWAPGKGGAGERAGCSGRGSASTRPNTEGKGRRERVGAGQRGEEKGERGYGSPRGAERGAGGETDRERNNKKEKPRAPRRLGGWSWIRALFYVILAVSPRTEHERGSSSAVQGGAPRTKVAPKAPGTAADLPPPPPPPPQPPRLRLHPAARGPARFAHSQSPQSPPAAPRRPARLYALRRPPRSARKGRGVPQRPGRAKRGSAATAGVVGAGGGKNGPGLRSAPAGPAPSRRSRRRSASRRAAAGRRRARAAMSPHVPARPPAAAAPFPVALLRSGRALPARQRAHNARVLHLAGSRRSARGKGEEEKEVLHFSSPSAGPGLPAAHPGAEEPCPRAPRRGAAFGALRSRPLSRPLPAARAGVGGAGAARGPERFGGSAPPSSILAAPKPRGPPRPGPAPLRRRAPRSRVPPPNFQKLRRHFLTYLAQRRRGRRGGPGAAPRSSVPGSAAARAPGPARRRAGGGVWARRGAGRLFNLAAAPGIVWGVRGSAARERMEAAGATWRPPGAARSPGRGATSAGRPRRAAPRGVNKALRVRGPLPGSSGRGATGPR